MIHVIIGGSCSGKTTFLRQRFLKIGGFNDRLDGMPITSCGPTCAIGHYFRGKRRCGVDLLGRDYPKIHDRIIAFISRHKDDYFDIAMEGNALADDRFLSRLVLIRNNGIGVKLYFLNPNVLEVRARYDSLGLKFGRSIMLLSYLRAFSAWHRWKGAFEHEMVAG